MGTAVTVRKVDSEICLKIIFLFIRQCSAIDVSCMPNRRANYSVMRKCQVNEHRYVIVVTGGFSLYQILE